MSYFLAVFVKTQWQILPQKSLLPVLHATHKHKLRTCSSSHTLFSNLGPPCWHKDHGSVWTKGNTLCPSWSVYLSLPWVSLPSPGNVQKGNRVSAYKHVIQVLTTLPTVTFRGTFKAEQRREGGDISTDAVPLLLVKTLHHGRFPKKVMDCVLGTFTTLRHTVSHYFICQETARSFEDQTSAVRGCWIWP